MTDPTFGMVPTESGVDTLNRAWHAVITFDANGRENWAGGMDPDGTYWTSTPVLESELPEECGGSSTAPEQEEIGHLNLDLNHIMRSAILGGFMAMKS
jgi:hypothetical protein